MANHPSQSAKNVTGDSATFTNFMRGLMQVPHSEIKAKLDAEKRTRTPKPASHASAVSPKRAI
jgi:hypothetical protein